VTVLRRAFVAASLVWVAAIPVATWLASRPHATLPGYAFALVVYGIGSQICHQLPARSFRLWSAQMPVCARCTGIYLGAAAAAVALAGRTRRPVAHSDAGDLAASRDRALIVIVCAALPTAATLIVEWTTGNMPPNFVRALAGLPLGAAAAWIVARSR
jgi:uncharacterized membrane protein